MNEKRLKQPPKEGKASLSSATVQGRTHRLWKQNSHDVAVCGYNQPQGVYWGLVLDGCGSKTTTVNGRIPSDNEVGAKLTGQFIDAWWQKCAAREEYRSLASHLVSLYQDYQSFLKQLLQLFPWSQVEQRVDFCSSHLLCTVIGFVVTPIEAAFFWQGDGYLCLNGSVIPLESDNRPAYPAYAVLAGKSEQEGFDTRFVDRGEVKWLAVASDGWHPALLIRMARPRSTLALERWLYVQARERGNFDDDGAVAALHLCEATSGNQETAPAWTAGLAP